MSAGWKDLLQRADGPVVDLSSKGLRDDDVKELCECLHANKSIVSVDLRGNDLRDAGVSALLQGLEQQCSMLDVWIMEQATPLSEVVQQQAQDWAPSFWCFSLPPEDDASVEQVLMRHHHHLALLLEQAGLAPEHLCCFAFCSEGLIFEASRRTMDALASQDGSHRFAVSHKENALAEKMRFLRRFLGSKSAMVDHIQMTIATILRTTGSGKDFEVLAISTGLRAKILHQLGDNALAEPIAQLKYCDQLCPMKDAALPRRWSLAKYALFGLQRYTSDRNVDEFVRALRKKWGVNSYAFRCAGCGGLKNCL
eukprot:TRINITY_DN5769_c0_g1_i2.p1 TRINITY_DN5769_c0_g1~~TRINITY_DN5769_c0_g1_i2.p1  ORF type:complete len:310 (+),score=37.83 TRINITY_DN5769_c0_g1_i2:108-1037(+)